MKKPHATVLLVTGLLALACSSGPSRLTTEERAAVVQRLLVRGTAHAEIKDWSEARGLFEDAALLAPADPAVAFDLALANLRLGDPDAARLWLDLIDERAPPIARARAELLRGRLELEAGDAAAEAAAYRAAATLDPAAAVYPYAHSQVLPRLGGPDVDGRTGELLERAHNLWPSNSRLAAELAQWLLDRAEPDAQDRGLALVEELVRAARTDQIEALVGRGRAELDAGDRPVALRRALNLLRPGKRFQKDSAALEARLQITPYAEPLSPELRGIPPAVVSSPGFEAMPLLPTLPLASGEKVLQIVASNDAVDAPPDCRREADLVVLTDRALWFLGRNEEAFQRLVPLPDGSRQLLTSDLDADGLMEIVTFSSHGVQVLARDPDQLWATRRLDPDLAQSDLRRVLLLDFEHDGDLDLLAVDGEDRILLVTHRGEAGWGPPRPAPLPIGHAAGPFIASDLDGDADQDLIVSTASGITILVNWRQGEFVAEPGPDLEEAAQELLAFDHDADGLFDLAARVGGQLFTWRNAPDLGLVPSTTPQPVETEAAEVSLTSLAVGDPDLDGSLDLVAGWSRTADGAAGLRVYSGTPSGLSAGKVTSFAAVPEGVLLLDLDGDRASDLLLWSAQGISSLRSEAETTGTWLSLGLRGLRGKVPLDGRGARVDVLWGIDRRSFEVTRPEITVGLGSTRPALVKVTWPNGISEYLHDPPIETRHQVEQVLRIEGSCPFLYASDGREMRFVTDILGLSPLGMLAAPDLYVTPDPEEYVRLPNWVRTAAGFYELRITEELREVAYIDQVELVVVDAPGEIEVYNGERWVEPPVSGLDLRLLGPLAPPLSVRDDAGREVLDQVAETDHRYLTNHQRRRLYQGATDPHSLTIELPAAVARAARPALILIGWLHWGNTSVNVGRAQDPQGAPLFPYLEVPDGRGGWRRTEVAVGLPAGKTKPVVVDLEGVVDAADPRVRLTTDFEVYWDQITTGERLEPAATETRLRRLTPERAELFYGGFSRWYRPATNGPYLFDYTDRRPVPWREGSNGSRTLTWREHQGYYTRFGIVTGLIEAIDDRLVVFGSGEELSLRFDAGRLPQLPDGWRRTLFLHTEGWEKDGDPNVACSETVEPYPRRAMDRYPCPAAGTDREAVASSLETGNRRWVDYRRLERRLRASAAPAFPANSRDRPESRARRRRSPADR